MRNDWPVVERRLTSAESSLCDRQLDVEPELSVVDRALGKTEGRCEYTSGPERDVPGHWCASEATQAERSAQSSSSSSFCSTTRVSVVRTRAAIEAALRSAERVTLTGSMIPAPMRSPYSPVAALES